MITNTKVKQKWLKALRSGNYKQGKYSLKKDRGKGVEHCCLGVLCDLAVKEGICKESFEAQTYFFDDVACLLPTSVFHWVGFKNTEGQTKLLKMNDDQSKTFVEIADYIEKSL